MIMNHLALETDTGRDLRSPSIAMVLVKSDGQDSSSKKERSTDRLFKDKRPRQRLCQVRIH